MASENINPVALTQNRGVNDHATALALAKQLLMDCESHGDITLPRATLKIVLMEFLGAWKNQQVQTVSSFKKVAQ